jgi:DNA-directed RNA polymerase specialized sigma24 family protein
VRALGVRARPPQIIAKERPMLINRNRVPGELNVRIVRHDASQEVFFRLVRYADFERVRTPDEFLGYVRVVCENVAADFLRDLVHSTVSLEDGLDEAKEENLTPANPEQLAITAELSELLGEALNSEERELLQLMTEGHKDAEMANRLGWSYAKTGVRIYRLRIKVRNFLKKLGL